MKLIVFGATGGTGKEVTKQALEAGHEVTVFVRDPNKVEAEHPHLTIVQGDALDMENVQSALKDQEAVISCLGASGLSKSSDLSTMAGHIVSAMKEQGVQRIGYVASAGIHKEIPGVVGMLSQLILRNVLKDHRQAVDLIKASEIHYTIARPMQLTNEPLTGTYRTDLTTVPSNGRKISRADVAHFLVTSISEDQHINESVGLAY